MRPRPLASVKSPGRMIGAGVLQADLLLAADVDAGRLVQLFPEQGRAGRQMHGVYAHARYRSTRLRSFLDFLVKRFPPPASTSPRA